MASLCSRHQLSAIKRASTYMHTWSTLLTRRFSTTSTEKKLRNCFNMSASKSNVCQGKYNASGVVSFTSRLQTSVRYLTSTASIDSEKSKVDITADQRADGAEETQIPPDPKPKNPVSWLSLALLMMTGGGLLFFYDKEKRRIEAARQVARQGYTESKPSPGVGNTTIGGPFKLTNHTGKEVTEQDFMGNWNLLYFGFTHCPDICPDELQKMVKAVDIVEKKEGIVITPVFISVDPERDHVEQLREYVKEFHPRLVGLTGAVNDIRQVARAYRIYFMKTEDEGSDYLVDHSIVMYLMDPKMEFVKFYGKNYTDSELADGIIEQIKNHKS